jgi:hypothetical protein
MGHPVFSGWWGQIRRMPSKYSSHLIFSGWCGQIRQIVSEYSSWWGQIRWMPSEHSSHLVFSGWCSWIRWIVSEYSSGVLHPGDEPHGSLFMYFRIFALIMDHHMITSHVTGITSPIPTFTDQLQWFLLICNDFRWFLPLADVSRSLQTLIWYHAALQKFYSLVKQLPRALACRDIKSARPHQHTTSAWHWSSNSEISQ